MADIGNHRARHRQAGGPADALRRAVRAEVAALFGPDAPVERSADGLFGPRSVAWRVNGDVVAMLSGGLAALLLQMLHPAVLAGVWDHSNFREDMAGRLRRTARFVALTTYGPRHEAERAIATVRAVHARVRGTLPDGTAYAADDPELLGWVHVSGATSFLAGWRRYAEPGMTGADQDRYFAEMAEVASALGVVRPPRDRREAARTIEGYRPNLRVDARTRKVAGIVLARPATPHPRVLLTRTLVGAGVALLPGWARHMHGRAASPIERAAASAGAAGLAAATRWALRPPRSGAARDASVAQSRHDAIGKLA